MIPWRRALVTVAVLLAWSVGAQAASTLKLPPPDLRGLVPLAALPLDKPPVPLPAVPLPPLPQGLPELPSPRLVTDPGQRPTAPLPVPRILACNPIGTVLHVTPELLECGRARYQRQEMEEAREAFEGALKSSDRRVLREARYWLGETLLRLGRTAEVERVFLLVVQDDPRSEFGRYAASELGWVALELGDPRRALGYFDGLLKTGPPPVLMVHARHGRAMALYGLKRHAEARDEWAGLLKVGGLSPPSGPRGVAGEATFWLGETLGRLGDYKGALAALQSFTAAPGPRILMESAFVRLGWWSQAAGQPADAAKAYRTLLDTYPNSAEALWARAGLVQALLDLDDYPAAREEARQLEAADRSRTFSLPTWLLVRRWLTDKSRPEDARALDDELLAWTLEPATRAWVLLVSAELARQSGQPDEARNRFELVRQSPSVPLLGLHAVLRLAQLDFELREFPQAEAGAKSLLGEALSPDLRTAVLVLGGEAAYWARDYDQAVGFYSRFLTDLPNHPEAARVGLALGWAEFRRGQLDAARQRWTSFARGAPSDPHAAEALLLSAELAAEAGDVSTAQALLGEIILKFQNTDQAQVATLNRAILAINAGQPAQALPELSLLVQRAPLSPYIGRARLAKGAALLATGRASSAQPDFQAALGQGEDALAHLGLGVVAFAGSDWDAAAREFAAARDAGSGVALATAEYGFAAATFNAGKTDEFKRLATSLLSRPDDPRLTPPVLLGMEALAAQEKRWPEAKSLALRLTSRFPQHEAAAAALADVGAAAGADAQWPLAREMYETLAKRYPGHPGSLTGRFTFGESLLRTGAPAEARRELEAFVKASTGDPRMPQALLLLAQAQEATGKRAEALDLYTRVEREYPDSKDLGTVLLGAARLLQADGKWREARGVLERVLNQSDLRVVTEAAYRLGEGLRAAGQNEEAAEAYMTAAYLGPDSSWARRALLGAGQSFAALKQSESAVIVYKKLLAASGVEPELAAAARSGLRALGVN